MLHAKSSGATDGLVIKGLSYAFIIIAYMYDLCISVTSKRILFIKNIRYISSNL